ncbi:MAG: hypothetical protein ACK56I_07350, partial [bacterium]
EVARPELGHDLGRKRHEHGVRGRRVAIAPGARILQERTASRAHRRQRRHHALHTRDLGAQQRRDMATSLDRLDGLRGEFLQRRRHQHGQGQDEESGTPVDHAPSLASP